MPAPSEIKGPEYYSGPRETLDRGAPRIIEKNRTYRIPKDGQTKLLKVTQIGDKSITVVDEATGKSSSMSRKGFENSLEKGEIYTTASLLKVLKGLVT